ncbi:MAG: leucine-rich repeat domain-containing protein [Ruminococcaceae bacterium]|nr:leucine-rich repeat domain-containing protein [Oscillospiraceae bacterium]
MKKLLSILLLVALLGTTALLFASCGDKSGLEFKLNDDGQSYTCIGFKEGKEAAEAIIPETYKDLPVTAIAANAFADNPLMDLYASAFGGKEESSDDDVALTSVTIPESVTKIGNQAFLGCKSLKSITLPANLKEIGSEAFARSGISGALTLPNTVKTLGMGAFSECAGLTSVTLSTGMTEIANSAFYKCTGLTSVTIPEGITTIEVGAFGKCAALTEVVIPDGVTKIEYDSFAECSALKKLTLPDTLEDWSRTAFSGCALEYETYENGKYIGNWLFYMSDKENVTSFKLKEGTVGIMDQAFSGCKNMAGAVVIPDTVKVIASEAFYGCEKITSVRIPASVKYVGRNAFAGWVDRTSANKTLVINCEVSEIPEEWNGNWYYSNAYDDENYTINWGK